jgi:AcrR family transcriptional regulator
MADLAERRKDLLDAMMRDAIYEGAVSVLSSHGIGGTTMDRVAAAAGVAKGTLYNHFRSKRDLLKFVHGKTCSPLIEATDEIASGASSPSEKLRGIIRMWREHVLARRVAFEFLINDFAARSILKDTVLSTRRDGIEKIAAVIEEGIEAGEFRPVHSLRAAEVLVVAAIGMIEEEFGRHEQRGDKDTVDVLIEIFLNGISAGAGQHP